MREKEREWEEGESDKTEKYNFEKVLFCIIKVEIIRIEKMN